MIAFKMHFCFILPMTVIVILTQFSFIAVAIAFTSHSICLVILFITTHFKSETSISSGMPDLVNHRCCRDAFRTETLCLFICLVRIFIRVFAWQRIDIKFKMKFHKSTCTSIRKVKSVRTQMMKKAMLCFYSSITKLNQTNKQQINSSIIIIFVRRRSNVYFLSLKIISRVVSNSFCR